MQASNTGSVDLLHLDNSPPMTLYSLFEANFIGTYYHHFFSDVPGGYYASLGFGGSWSKTVYNKFSCGTWGEWLTALRLIYSCTLTENKMC